ncbi:MAG TPA: ATP-dependent RNA helicase HrpA [Gemmatimonadaceae bacterium]|nr:ATP-dependent RNA helicase HrpA [Gemmatimonadaceae bacterium]
MKALLPHCLLHDWVRLGSRLVRLLRDRHHPERHDALLRRILDEALASIALREARRINVPRVSYPPNLPISVRKDEIVAAIRDHQVEVIAGETGSGKTTQIPKMCLEAGLGIGAMIGCTQPRRVAALSISRRIAEELNVTWGREVGCKIRFDDRSGAHTYIKLMTDGILLAETQGDPTLAEYNALILDEAHERSLNIDFLLGYLKGLLVRRQDLKLIVTSATIDTQAFSRHFDDAPIIEVSGRLYPVDLVYQPLDAASEERGDISFVDAAVQAAERILCETNSGDVLIFMPGERDIRETSDQLEGRFHGEAEVIPLFGRLSSGDQQRVFASSPRRKIVIATNIAETSLTIPGIRYVIDAGLARISRYNPRTRTRRLPVEAVSQSSANQRKGRAGRVEAGVCIRLYSEEDFSARPPFTQPEIQRANLAEVILRMKAFGLGDIEAFPFVQAPTPASISHGFALLQELGALDDRRELTPLGRDLARLPIDPTIGRMLLQSQREHATHELLIIAAGLSIQDPRERPLDQKDAAAAAHKKFNDPKSDFLALLNIWNSVHDQWDQLRTQNARRKFCRQQFLSYLRMREWQDLYSQLHDALENLGTLKLNESNADYDAIHRSILAGLIGHVARREERNLYKAEGNRLLNVFPGSALFERGEASKKHASKPDRSAAKPSSSQPQWIVAGEIVETSQLFVRTLAGIDPQWIFKVAPHCCKVTHQAPHWSASAARVLVEEVITLHGLEVQRRKVAYGNINPKDATAIFIRSALVEDNLEPKIVQRRSRPSSSPLADEIEDNDSVVPPSGSDPAKAAHRFLAHNRAVRQKIENWQTRVRRHDLADLDQAMFDFYAKHLEHISSTHDLNRLLREQADLDFLCVHEADLAGGAVSGYDAAAFPDVLPVGGQPVALAYAYAPGEDHDGVTIQLPFCLAQSASASLLEWAVPGLREEKISTLLRALPKAIRRGLMPFPPKIAEIVRDFKPAGAAFLADLGRFLEERYGVSVPASAWPANAMPAHLRARIEIVSHDQQTLASGRDLDQLRRKLADTKIEPAKEPVAWQRVAAQWECFDLREWTCGDLPERVTVSEGPGLPVYGWPGLHFEDGNVNVRLFRSQDAARAASIHGVQRLAELAIEKDLAWIEKDLRALSRFGSLYAPLGDIDALRESAFEHLKRHLLPAEPLAALSEAHFRSAVDAARSRLPGLVPPFIERVGLILQLGQQVQQRLGPAVSPLAPRPRTLNQLTQLTQPTAPAAPTGGQSLAGELAALLPPRFLEQIPFDRLPHIPRYLKALLTRIERAVLNPSKDQERARQIAPYQNAWNQLQATSPRSSEARQAMEEFRWMIEEFKVSVFAQELGTAVPVSAKRLDEKLTRIRQAGA